ncbi:hypothetical protein BDF21DRAFT_377161 [Thamnidium elegans]|uniref:Replication protein A 32 kDa subunit n=1 Tax=Thamnidium elegans TaxID=101142 RepID=A0A8H7SZR6_9FUNG|nr:hypothetical protein INT48_006597 [Thamnidium elegans]KAI8092086.1 hypothetical protein BDF21DRAFT_377161 [Thamnidium elegans]
MDYGNTGSGYMNASFDGSNKTSSTPHTRRPMGEQTLRPVTVKQIKTCSIPQDQTFKIDGSDVTQTTFIGVIRGIQELQTNYVYTIEDGTGAIEVRKWVETNETPEEAEARRLLMVDTYVRVNGRINSFGNRINIVCHTMNPITDFNEITYHLLDTIETHLKFAKPSSSSAMDIDTGSNKPKAITDHVTEVIEEFTHTTEGCNVEHIVFKLKGKYTEAEIRETIEYLENEGSCYTTIDSEHIKSCAPN